MLAGRSTRGSRCQQLTAVHLRTLLFSSKVTVYNSSPPLTAFPAPLRPQQKSGDSSRIRTEMQFQISQFSRFCAAPCLIITRSSLLHPSVAPAITCHAPTLPPHKLAARAYSSSCLLQSVGMQPRRCLTDGNHYRSRILASIVSSLHFSVTQTKTIVSSRVSPIEV